jgi:hypothetical protein
MDRVRETAAWSAGELAPPEPGTRPAWRAGLIRSRYVVLVAAVLLALAAAGTAVVLTSHDTGAGALAGGTSSPSGSNGGPVGSSVGPSTGAGPSASASAKPSASTTPKPGGTGGSNPLPPPVSKAGGCAPNPSACGFPDSTNTGVPAGVKLTAKTGDMAIKTAGATISGIDLQGCIRIYVTNVTIKNSKIHCGGPYGVFSYEGDYTGGGALIEDTEIDCMNTQATGIGSYGYKALRVDVHGCENGFIIDYGVTVQDSYVHEMFTGNGGHSDGIQMGGNNDLIIHNTVFNLSDGGTSAIISDPSNMSNTTISDNLLAGGGYSLYCPRTTSSNVTVTSNRFGKIFSSKGGSFAAWVYCDQVAMVKANVWDDTLAAVAF